jgi:hypothetical protein
VLVGLLVATGWLLTHELRVRAARTVRDLVRLPAAEARR